MKKMRFLPELAEFLKKNGYIYTVRKYPYSLSGEYVQIDGAGICQRVHLGQIHKKADLEAYTGMSGFNSVNTWWKKIKEFIKTPGSYYLYEITLEEDRFEEKNA